MKKTKPCTIIFPEYQLASYKAAITENPENSKDQGEISMLGMGNYNKFWKPGRTLKICFLEPVTSSYRLAFARTITKWADHANLKFTIVEGDADIRITTNTEDNKSVTGTDALTIDKSLPTMHITSTLDDEDFQQTVLHEMGHAIGYMHEHLHRDANIPWNREKVYDYYLENYQGDKQRVDDKVLTPYSGVVVDTAYDKNSIMHYEIDKELTDGVWEVGLNTELSERDKKMARRMYPVAPDDVPWKVL